MTELTREDLTALKRVVNNTGSGAAEAVKQLPSALALHYFAVHYNSNDGFLPLIAVAEHPLCDEGTALRIYFYFADFIGKPDEIDQTRGGDPDRDKGRDRTPEFDLGSILDVLERRFAARDFRSAEFHFDPLAYLGLPPTEIEWLAADGIPRERLEPVGHVRITSDDSWRVLRPLRDD